MFREAGSYGQFCAVTVSKYYGCQDNCNDSTSKLDLYFVTLPEICGGL